ncbi:MAG: NADH-quinone oxidoreductase subunit NuoF [Firmicutes bacterium]|nr:NADH-quinone oxidoreductase subunit NuoF [Bacillota bacterium]
MSIKTIQDLANIKQSFNDKKAAYKQRIYVCGGGGCISSNCLETKDAVVQSLKNNHLEDTVDVVFTGCMGTCAVGPVIYIEPDDVFYTKVTAQKAEEIIQSHIIGGKVLTDYTFFDNNLQQHIPHLADIPFFAQQVQIALRNCGKIDFASVENYIAKDGYAAIAKAVTSMTPAEVVDEVKKSGLRGRGGGGFPTGIKWEAGMNAVGDQKYIVCNADEGDPGAFMDRSLLEGDPHGIIEGMMLGGYAIGANMGYIYVRAEYPIAVDRLGAAIEEARKQGILGNNIFGSNFNFDLEIRIGAGAFVCGEETALMASIEGERGEPKQKPPFPFERGLYGCPTIINNVETYANVPAIINKGADWFASFGVGKSKGTKVFALAGDIVNTGLVEVPMGISLGDLIYKIGGGIRGGKSFKAAQVGGPSGGCLTKEYLNTSVDYESLTALGAIMGSGGLIVMSEDTCMVDTARFFLDFIQDESCGKCTPCRLGTKRMLEILQRITKGEGTPEDLDALEELAHTIKDTAMCGLGQTAPNPILSTMKNFRREYEDHILDKHCTAGVCSAMFISPCQNACPAGINVPGYMALIQEGKFIEAYNLIRRENPFPAVCGRICTHPCEAKCRRGQRDEALAICDLKRFVADYAMSHEDEMVNDEAPVAKNGKKVAIIGAGPSGLTCAHYLARLGYEVDVFESQPIAGGVLAYGIPEYRLPNDVLEYEVNQVRQQGVNIHLNCEVGKDVSFQSLRQDYDAVYVATGTQFPNKAGVDGEDLKGVYYGLDFLHDVALGKPVQMGKKVAVIGGGNTAIDAARTAVRMGAESVTIVYRRTRDDMPADKREIAEALEEGVQLMTLTAPVRFVGENGQLKGMDCDKMQLGEYDRGGRRKPVKVENSQFFLEADMIIPAISQHADFPFITQDDIQLTSWGSLVTDRANLMTSLDGVFAGGDVARGSDMAITAIADGKKAAASIDKYLGGKGELNKGEDIEIPAGTVDDDPAAYNRFAMEILSPETRRNNFREVVQGYRKLNAVAEANRCLRCDRK